MSQREKIRNHLDKYGSITPLEALREYGCMRLAARIGELIKEGYKIIKIMERGQNRNGDPVYYAKYVKAIGG